MSPSQMPAVIELFGCSGGMAEGFRRARIPTTWSVDWGADACESYTTNLGYAPIRMDVRDLLRLLEGGWRPPPLDLLVADPPCTPWSTAGRKRGLDDPRDMLRPTIAIIELLKPRAYLIGNVPGLQHANAWPVAQELIGGFAAHGYCANDFAQLDAANYGVPQHRKRPFWFGHLEGRCLQWPEPTHGDPAKIGHAELGDTRRPWITCRDALGHLTPVELGAPIRVSTSKHPSSRVDDPALSMPASRPGNGGAYLEWPWDRPATTVCTDSRLAPPGHHSGSWLTPDRHGPSKVDEPARTVTARDRGARDGQCIEWLQGHDEQRGPNAIKLSEKAAAILQGFPEGWVFAGKTKRSRWSQLGQATPPPLAEAVAHCIRAWFEKYGELAA